jgi:plasmid stabilization system protein ParE
LTSLTPAMAHRLRITQEAKSNIAGISAYIAKDSPANARRWRLRIRERIRSLSDLPVLHEIAYPASLVGRDIRHAFFGVYRILYDVRGDDVFVLSVRHGGRRPLTPDEVRRLG